MKRMLDQKVMIEHRSFEGRGGAGRQVLWATPL